MKIKPLLTAAAIVPIAVGGMSLTGCGSNEPCVGEWYAIQDIDGESTTGILILDNDNTGKFLAVNENDDMGPLTLLADNKWEKTGENTYTVTSSTGNEYTLEYRPVTETLVQDDEIVYYQTDPIDGIWMCDKYKDGTDATVTAVFREDGYAVFRRVDENGIVLIEKIQWENNFDGTYSILNEDGTEQQWKINNGNNKLTTENNHTFKKVDVDYNNLDIGGLWYNEEISTLTYFFADGRGIIKSEDGVVNFTWEYNSDGSIEISGTSGFIKGKNYTWTYEDDAITGPYSGTFIRVTDEEIDGFVVVAD